jgi:hypothetical protein
VLAIDAMELLIDLLESPSIIPLSYVVLLLDELCESIPLYVKPWLP